MARSISARNSSSGRIRIYDALRGLSVVSMIAFHACYDLKFIYGQDLSWFAPPLIDIWRASISWTFLFIAGAMVPLSRNNFKRAGSYLAVALAVYVATTVAEVDSPISFGIIFCMGICTLVGAILQKFKLLPRGPVAAAAFFAVFILFLDIPQGTAAFGSVEIPEAIYSTGLFSWAGFPGKGFVSGDYYPVFPYIFMYLSGTSLGMWWKTLGYSKLARTFVVRPLNFIGKNALVIYAAHQPIIMAIISLVLSRS